jgi:hypothetical protein
MMFRGVVFREVIDKVGFAGLPMDAEVALADTVAYPIEAHVDCFRVALFDGIIDDAMGAGVIDLDGCWQLRPIHFFEGVTRRGQASWALWKHAPTSASVAEERTLCIMLLTM